MSSSNFFDESKPLSQYTVTQLKAIAKDYGVKGYSKMLKNDLILTLSSGTYKKKISSSKSPIKPKSPKIISSKKEHATEYKFRAEGLVDVINWLASGYINFDSITINKDLKFGFPDVDVILYSKDTLSNLRDSMKKIPDSHVMVETLNYSNIYTGYRWYEEE